MAEISIILKAIDKYSGVITGLNQGFELVAKAANALKWSADVAFEAISKGVKLIEKGGEFREQESQLKNLSEAYGQNANEIVNAIKKIGSNSTNLSESLKLSTKAIVSGLSGPEIESTLKFVKKFTEATGDSFADMSQQVFQAMSSGRYSILKQMGVFVEKGTSASDVSKILASRLALFGEAAFNAGDNFEALKTAQDDFLTRIGAAINDVPILAEVLNSVTDSVVFFVNSFDTAPITRFLEFTGRILEALYVTFVSTFGDIGNMVYETLKDLATEKGFKSFAKSAIESLRGVANFWNTWGTGLLKFASFTIFTLGMVAEGWGKLYSFIKTDGLGVVAYLGKIFSRFFINFSKMLTDFIVENPLIQLAVPGLEGILDKVQEWQRKVMDVTKFADKESKESLISNIGNEIEDLGLKAKEFSMSLITDGIQNVNAFADSAIKAIDSIKYPDFVPGDNQKKRTKEELDMLKAIAQARYDDNSKSDKASKDKQKTNKQNIDDLKKLSTLTKNLSSDSEKAGRVMDSMRISEIGEGMEARQPGGGISGTLSFGEEALAQLSKQERNMVEKLGYIVENRVETREEEINRLMKKLQLEKLEKELKDFSSQSEKDSRRKEDIQREIIPEAKTALKQKSVKDEIAEYLAAINWPQELNALGEFFLGFLIAKARNERTPLTISTY